MTRLHECYEILGLGSLACQMEPLLSCQYISSVSAVPAHLYDSLRDYLKHAVIAAQLPEGVRGVQSSSGKVRSECKPASGRLQKQLNLFLSVRSFYYIFQVLIPSSSPVLALTSPLSPLLQSLTPPLRSPTAPPEECSVGPELLEKLTLLA